AHCLQTATGFEWGTEGMRGRWSLPSILATLLAAAAVALVAFGAQPVDEPAAARRRVLGAALLWTACGLVPVAAVAPIWSAYYYLFALCGAALTIGLLCARARGRAGVAAIATVVV